MTLLLFLNRKATNESGEKNRIVLFLKLLTQIKVMKEIVFLFHYSSLSVLDKKRKHFRNATIVITLNLFLSSEQMYH